MSGWGIVGTGRMAATMVPVLAGEGARVVGVASRDPGRGAAFAAAHGIAGAGDRAALLGRVDVDVVYVATPVASHRADCLAALAAGKHVLCEKPLAATAAEAREVAAAAAAAGRFCMEALWTQCLPAVGEAVRRVREGAIGTPLHVQGSFGIPTPAGVHASSGGVLLDRGCYPISLAMRLLGEIAAVAGEVRRDAEGTDVDAVLLLTFVGGATASIGVSFLGYLGNDLVISGSAGRLLLAEPITRTVLLGMAVAGGVGGKGGGAMRRIARRWPKLPALRRLRTDRAMPVRGDGYGYQVAEVERCLRAGLLQSDVVPLSLSIATIAVMDAARGLVAVDGFEPPTKGL